jgi:hypothetical protein
VFPQSRTLLRAVRQAVGGLLCLGRATLGREWIALHERLLNAQPGFVQTSVVDGYTDIAS